MYNLLIFYRYMCSYIALLLNDRSTPMVKICCFSCSDWNIPLTITHLCLNKPIEGILSTTLVNALDLENCDTWEYIPSVWNILTLHMEGFWDVSYELWYYFNIDLDHMLKVTGKKIIVSPKWIGTVFFFRDLQHTVICCQYSL